MNISAKTEYACLALLELARQYALGRPVQVRKIVAAHGIPAPFLVQILLQLKAAGLVTSTRGVSGGYYLARDPQAITLREVFAVIEGPAPLAASNAGRPTPVLRALARVWQQVADAERSLLDGTTLASLLENAREPSDGMYYI
jgi:Rrf2 family protein